MNFAQQPQPTTGKFVGIGIAIAFHVALGYALVTGLGTKVIEIIKAPIETKVIEEAKKPPPPEIAPPPPPKLDVPPPPFIPPPEVQIAVAPQPQQSVIAATVSTPPPVVPPPAAPPPAPAPPKPAVVAIGVACPKMVAPQMPARAVADEISGAVTAQVTVRGGKVTDVKILKSQPRGIFDAAVRTAMMQYQCQSTGDQEVQAVQEFAFKNGD